MPFYIFPCMAMMNKNCVHHCLRRCAPMLVDGCAFIACTCMGFVCVVHVHVCLCSCLHILANHINIFKDSLTILQKILDQRIINRNLSL